jgi:hypothetical protein
MYCTSVKLNQSSLCANLSSLQTSSLSQSNITNNPPLIFHTLPIQPLPIPESEIYEYPSQICRIDECTFPSNPHNRLKSSISYFLRPISARYMRKYFLVVLWVYVTWPRRVDAKVRIGFLVREADEGDFGTTFN